MTRTQIYLPENLHKQLAYKAKIEKTTISALIRKSLTMNTIKPLKKQQKNFLEVFSDIQFNGPSDLSTNHTRYYVEAATKIK